MEGWEFCKPILAGIIATPVAYALAMFLSVGGFYNPGAIIIFFPYLMLSKFLFKELSDFLLWTLILLQFPLYGLTFSAATVKDKFRTLAIGLAIAHLLIVMLCVVINVYTDAY